MERYEFHDDRSAKFWESGRDSMRGSATSHLGDLASALDDDADPDPRELACLTVGEEKDPRSYAAAKERLKGSADRLLTALQAVARTMS